jgi:hypothetical protein
MICPISLCWSTMTLLSWGISLYMVDLCMIQCSVLHKCNMVTMGLHVILQCCWFNCVCQHVYVKISYYYVWIICTNFYNYVFLNGNEIFVTTRIPNIFYYKFWSKNTHFGQVVLNLSIVTWSCTFLLVLGLHILLVLSTSIFD